MKTITLNATKEEIIHLKGSKSYYEMVTDWESCYDMWEFVPRSEADGKELINVLNTTLG